MNLPATLPNISDIVNAHDRSFALYNEAFDKIAEADAAVKRAFAEIESATPGAVFHHERDAHEVHDFHKAVRLPEKRIYLSVARKLLTLRCWHYIVDRCGMQQLMDAQAKKELDGQLRYVPDRSRGDRDLITDEELAKGPPPFTVENVEATIAKFAGEADMIWRRGIANAFSQFDRRFRSHDGFKVGSRVILTYFASTSTGRVESYGRSAEVFRDIERTFQILDNGDPRSARSDFLYQINQERRGRNPHQSEHENPYFKVRIFINGNAHLWFTRPDLVRKVNKELAAYYGEVIGDGQTQEPDPLESRAMTPAKVFGFYPTPTDLAARIVAQVPYNKGSLRILEPSAGSGTLAYHLAKLVQFHDEQVQHRVDCIEIQHKLADDLRNSGAFNSTVCADFLKVVPGQDLYDGVVMNPPFDRERDIDHVTHALKFLEKDGFLLAIMSAGTEFRETRKAAAFRKLLADRGGWMIDLPAGSFAEVGTHVNTVLVGFGMRQPYSI